MMCFYTSGFLAFFIFMTMLVKSCNPQPTKPTAESPKTEVKVEKVEATKEEGWGWSGGLLLAAAAGFGWWLAAKKK
jgi:hypothetical protein